jgi:hypothetical protein
MSAEGATDREIGRRVTTTRALIEGAGWAKARA